MELIECVGSSGWVGFAVGLAQVLAATFSLPELTSVERPNTTPSEADQSESAVNGRLSLSVR